MGQKRNYYLPTVARTKDETVNRNLDSIFDTFRRLSQIIGDILDGNQSQDIDRKVASGATDATPDVLINKVASDGTIAITEDTTAKKVKFIARAGSTSRTGLLQLSTSIPTLDGGTGSAGAEGKAADGAHQHPNSPTVALTKRYYFSNVVSDLTDGSPSQHTLFSLTNSGAGYALSPPGGGLGALLVDGPVGSPGLTTWPAGVVMATIWARVRNPQIGEQYHLDCGAAPQDSSLGRATATSGEYAYQTSPWPGIQTPLLTASYQQYVVPMAVMASPQVGQTGTASTDRLRCQLTGAIEGTTPAASEVFEVLCMGATPSYLDTIFTPSSGATVHNDLTGRDAANCHPMASITAGWLQTPTSQRAVVGGLLALASSTPPVTSNSVKVVGAGPLVGVETTGKNDGDELTLFFLSAMAVTNNGTTGDAAYAPIALGTQGLGTPLQDVAMTQYSCLKVGWYDGVWRPIAPWFICEAT